MREHVFWAYKRWAVEALAAQGRKEEALRLAESSRGPWSSDLEIDRLGEEILLSSGMVEEAYQRYGLSANRAGTYLATFRAVVKKYPSKEPQTILEDLVQTTPREEGKWFAAAKSAGLLEEALDLARHSPCDPRTLTRAARDFAAKEPAFAVEAGASRAPLAGPGARLRDHFGRRLHCVPCDDGGRRGARRRRVRREPDSGAVAGRGLRRGVRGADSRSKT